MPEHDIIEAESAAKAAMMHNILFILQQFYLNEMLRPNCTVATVG
jgi:hypothetical protein